jgi:hypothetical protein
VYENASATPYQRLFESAEASEESKAELKRRKGGQNPVALNTALNKAVEKLLKINREKANMKQASYQEAGQAKRSDFGWVLVLRNQPLFAWINFEAMRAIDKEKSLQYIV